MGPLRKGKMNGKKREECSGHEEQYGQKCGRRVVSGTLGNNRLASLVGENNPC